MRLITVVGVLLIVVGLVALVYQGITYTSRETVIDIGPLHATADRQSSRSHAATIFWARIRDRSPRSNNFSPDPMSEADPMEEMHF
jgi:hypothetical protein